MSSKNIIPRNIANPLKRDGTSQDARLLDILLPSSIKIDGKGIDDWLRDANTYAKMLRYYNPDNVAQGDWSSFMMSDISSLITLLNAQHPTELRTAFLDKLNQLEAENEKKNSLILTESLVKLQDYANQIYSWYDRSDIDTTIEEVSDLLIHSELSRLIPSVIEDGYSKVIEYLKEGENIALPFQDYPNGNFHISLLEEQWPLEPILGMYTPLEHGIPTTEPVIETEISRLKALYDRFYEVHVALYPQAESFLNNSLDDFPVHQSHMALFIACLRVFQITQESLNGLSKKHLDFYYQEVLKLDFRDEIADKVHLIFELAQNFVDAKVDEDKVFLAGKDKIGQDLLYTADNELIVNEAQLEVEIGLKSLHIQKLEELDDDGNRSIEVVNIFAAPDADSKDGLGEELTSSDKQWYTFGTNDPAKTPYAEMGFAIASPMFLLGEGKRILSLRFQFADLPELIDKYGRAVLKTELRQNIAIYYSGSDEWVEIPKTQVFVQVETDVLFQISLTEEDPAVVPYQEEVLQTGISTSYPVLRFIMDNEGLNSAGNLDLNSLPKLRFLIQKRTICI